MPATLLTDLLDLVLPAGCAGCGLPGISWCGRCAGGAGPARLVTGLPGAPPTVAAGIYSGPLRRALLAYKERGRRALAAPLAGLVAGAMLEHGLVGTRCWLVPAPSRAAAARARGGDHVLALVHELAEQLVAPARSVGVSPVLRMRAGARDSVGLDSAARAANLHGRIVTRKAQLPPSGVGVLLIDDVVTTGATLRACANALATAGVPVVGAAVLCDATGVHPRNRWSASRPAR